MTNKLHVLYATLRVPLLFEGKDGKQQIYVTANASYSIGTPGPKLRTDVIDNSQATAMKRVRQSQIKVRPVNENHRIGLPFHRHPFQ